MQGEWIRRPQGEASAVFLHGVLSSGETCWQHDNGSYWPELLKNEPELQWLGIYVFTYETGFFSGSYSLSDIVDDLKERMRLDGLLESGRLIFVCHSMGGIVVRKFIVSRAADLIGAGKEIDLFLVASPSLGATYANWLSPLAQFFGHTQADALRFVGNNYWLKDLDKEFMNLKEGAKLKIKGKELVEDKFVILKKLWRKPVVEPFSGARYFGEPYKVPKSDHFSIAKPYSKDAIQHRLLCQFILENTLSPRSKTRNVLDPEVEPSAPVASPTQPHVVSVDISRIDKYAPTDLIGREDETRLLDEAWAKAQNDETGRPRVLTFVGLGGEGKTSLVAKWAADLADQNWPGCEKVFAWSFYNQGTRDQVAASSDLFLKEALTFFGDSEVAASAQGAFDKGRRLAQLVGEKRALLILDGVEPLQFAPSSPTSGELKDSGLAALLKGLAANNKGLCVVTTRYSISDLKPYRQATAPEVNLPRLSMEAGVALLRSLGVVTGSQAEFEALVEDVKGHALTLNLLGAWLHDAHDGDIRKRDLVKLEEADEDQSGHAFRVMDAYVQWFESEGKHGKIALAFLRLMGLFDRPAEAGCLKTLWKAPFIPDLTEPLASIREEHRNRALNRLEDAKLITVNRDQARTLLSLDAHPLLREYFAKALREQHLEAWRAAHRRLYEHLCKTQDKPNPTLEDLQPLYQAVAHGCKAGLQRETWDRVFDDRIQRGQEAYSTKKLSAFGSDLGATACFFEQPWSSVSPAITEEYHGWLLNHAAFGLCALGRLTEAVEPMRAGLGMTVEKGDWSNAATDAGNLSELNLNLGDLASAVADAKQAVTHADRSGDVFIQKATRTTYADALHQAGLQDDAEKLFCDAEDMQASSEPNFPLLYSLGGFRYCDFHLAAGERAAWRRTLNSNSLNQSESVPNSCRAVSERAAQTIKIAEGNTWLLDIGLDHLTLGRAALYAAILEGLALDQFDPCRDSLQHAVDGLRRAGRQEYLPLGLLTRAWLRFFTGAHTSLESAQTDLDEAWEIAVRGPMPLHMANIHLHRTRLFGLSQDRPVSYPWTSPQHDLAEARRLIEKHGYWRRKEELEDAEAAAARQ